MFCPKCGKELPDDSQFCLKCGHALIAAPSEPKQAVKRPALAVPLAIGALLLVAAFVIWRVFIYHPLPQSPASMLQSTPTKQADQTKAAPVQQPAPRTMTPQDIFRMASGAMVLIEGFDDEGRKRQQGSAFVVSTDGTAITNYHVIRGATRATGKYEDGTWSEVSGVVGYDPLRDVAVIHLSNPPKTFLNLGDSGTVQVGQRIVAIGSPLGLQNTLSVGIVSGVRNGVIQMTDPISPGSSGGAVFDPAGNVIGISVATIALGQNLNFAVPINWAKPYLNSTNVRPLKDVAAENSVTEDVLSGTVTIPAAQVRSWNITLNPNVMSDAEVHGEITSSGGMDGKITLALYFNNQPLYTCRSNSCAIHQPMTAAGTYVLILDNRISPIFGRTVTGQISLKYAK
jgi:S1-C subfamily serine protease